MTKKPQLGDKTRNVCSMCFSGTVNGGCPRSAQGRPAPGASRPKAKALHGGVSFAPLQHRGCKRKTGGIPMPYQFVICDGRSERQDTVASIVEEAFARLDWKSFRQVRISTCLLYTARCV